MAPEINNVKQREKKCSKLSLVKVNPEIEERTISAEKQIKQIYY